MEKLKSLQSNADVLRQSQEQRRDPALHVPQVASYLQRVGLEVCPTNTAHWRKQVVSNHHVVHLASSPL